MSRVRKEEGLAKLFPASFCDILNLMTNDQFYFIAKVLILISVLIYILKYAVRWFKTSLDAIKDNQYKGFTGLGIKIMGVLMLISGVLFAFLFISSYLGK